MSICGLFVLNSLFSYTQTKDFGLWANFSLSKKISKKVDASCNFESRFHENATRLDAVFADFAIDYSIKKYLGVEAAYRPILAYDIKSGYQPEHRFFVGLFANIKFNDVKISYKIRVQEKFSDMYKNSWSESANTLRNKVSVKYTLFGTPFRPFVSCEIFNPIENNSISFVNKARYVGGCDYLFSKKMSLSLFYLLQQEYNTKNPEQLHVLGVGFDYEL